MEFCIATLLAASQLGIVNAEQRASLPTRECLLMGTCLCDAFFDDVAQATVEVLEHLGCTIHFPENQTCCGQPAFNAGDWPAARKVIRHTLEVFAGDLPIVLPSGSCTHMVHHGYELAMEKEADRDQAEPFAQRTWELCDYIVNGLGVREWPGQYKAKLAFHRSCHTRGGRTAESALQLLGSIQGVELCEVGEPEQCCGFGGTFSVAFPNISERMGRLKLEHLTATQPDAIAATDMACMLHIGGILDQDKVSMPRLHVVQILRDALRSAQPEPTTAQTT